MRRFTLSTKLFAAAAPLILAVATLLTLTVRNDLAEVDQAERSADLGGTWAPLSSALGAIEAEVNDGYTDRLADTTAIQTGRAATDAALTQVSSVVNQLGLGAAAATHATDAQIAVRAGRTAADGAAMMNGASSRIDPLESYEAASRQLVSIGQLLPAVSGDADLGADLLAIVRLSEARLAATSVLHATERWNSDPSDPAILAEARASYTELEAVLAEFEATAQSEWADQYRASGFPLEITDYRTQLDSVIRAAQRGETREFDTEGFSALVARGVLFEAAISQSIVDDAVARADSTRSSTLMRIGVTLAALLIATAVAWWMTRSVTRRVKEVASSANQVASEQLPALVEALRDPRGKTMLPTIAPVSAKGTDELAELAHAFNSMQATLVSVAHEQVEVLRRGVSDIFVTMARRNRSLIDRQLAMLDEFEAEVDDPDVLSNYYQLDHMATRMRRNSESLLVLANAEPKRRRVKATEIDDVVRAAIGEVEDYRRVEIEALESLQVRGNVVADVSHLLAELLDNATSFSPPDSLVRVGGRRAGDSYMLRIVDNGVGIGADRLRELNELLREPPIVGLSVEPTLGMSVVSLLANRHGIAVMLSQGNPGTTVDVLLPSSLFGPIDVPIGGAAPAALPVVSAVDQADTDPYSFTDSPQAIAPVPSTWTDAPDEPMVTTGSDVPPVPVAETERFVEPDAAPSWTTMSFDLSSVHADTEPISTPTPEPQFAVIDAPPAPLADDVAAIPAPITAAPIDPVPAVPTAPSRHDDVPAPLLAPPTVHAPAGEFDRPLAPPMTADGPSRLPVAPADAHPAPAAHALEIPATDPMLPTRSPGRGPDGGHDRLASFGAPGMTSGDPGIEERSVTTTSSPSALQAALAAFDARRNGEQGSLPTRAPSTGFAAPNLDETQSISQARLDPDLLRERLRAFQTEFRTGSADGGTEPNTSTTNADLGGDRR